MTAKILPATTDARLSVMEGEVEVLLTGAGTPDSDQMVRFDLTGLDADTAYSYQVKLDGTLIGPAGKFRTLPAGAPSGTPCSFTCAFAGDAETRSERAVFRAIVDSDPLFFIHLGDLHYENISTNSPALFHAAYDTVLRSRAQAPLYREVPTVYVWDDHDYGANNSDGTSASKPAAAAAYRSRVPHYPLEESTSIYHSFDVGRVRFIVTDQRSAATPNAATDDSSKSMLGTAQKTWFKDLLSNSSGKLIVWICPRWFRQGVIAATDSWTGFTTERAEIVDHIHTNCSGRVIVISADLHTLAIDDGTNFDFATSGSEPLPVFQAAALDQSPVSGGDTYTEGEFLNFGQWGKMAIADSGGATIDVTWTGHDSTGAVLATLNFSVAV